MPGADVSFDTNILLYLLSKDANKAERTDGLLSSGGVISVQVLNEFAAAALGKKAVDFVELREILSSIRVACTVEVVDVKTHERGLDIAECYKFSIYDSMIVAAALQAGCTTLFSEDLQNGQTIEGLTIKNPFVE